MGAEFAKLDGTQSSNIVDHEFPVQDKPEMLEQADWTCMKQDAAVPPELSAKCARVINDASITVQSCSHLTVCRTSGEWTGKQLDMDSSWPHQRGPNLMTLLDSFQPVFGEIVGYVASSPRHFVRLCALASQSLAVAVDCQCHPCWAIMYSEKWPALYDCLSYHGAVDWRSLYRETFAGRLECVLEVFDREKKLGFAMAAMTARIQYDAKADSYVARYLSASEVMPEVISLVEEQRLRFCPESARAQLMPQCPFSQFYRDAKLEEVRHTEDESYPYRVLEGIESLTVGEGVELQWKMQRGSPFGWWYGHLESLKIDADVARATAVIVFSHFPSNSRWYRLQVRFGGPDMMDCPFGGYTGGLRPVSDKEQRHWMRFFPKKPVIF